ncbi:recombinase family protein, partial [bacterium]
MINKRNKKKTACAVYTRVSTDAQAEKEFNSCEVQLQKIESFIKSQEGFEIYEVYSDGGYTGANTNRPALQQMMEDISYGEIDMVISYKIDRLTRSPKDFYNLVEVFERYNVGYLSITERFDTLSPSGRLLRNIMLIFAQFERELIAERTRDKLTQRAKQGLWNGGFVPFGYRREAATKRLLIDENDSKAIRQIYETYIETRSVSKVLEVLKEKRMKSRSGKWVSKSNIFKILRNPLYTGKIVYANNTYQGIHEAIINEEFYNLAQKLHKDKTCKFKMYKNHLFAGLMTCTACGKQLTPSFVNNYKKGKMKRYYYYRCTSTYKKTWDSCSLKQVNAKSVEKLIIENLTRISKDNQFIENLVFRLNHETENRNEKRGAREGLETSKGRSFEPKNSLPPRGRGRLEKTRGRSVFEPKVVKKIISELVKATKNGHIKDRNFYIKNYVKNILFSHDWVEMELYYTENFGHPTCPPP